MKKSEQPPRFICMNNPHFERNFVVHTRQPQWLAEVFTFSSEADALKFGGDQMNNPDLPGLGGMTWHNGKHYVLWVIELWGKLPPVANRKQADKLARLPRRMADWYLHAVLKQNNISYANLLKKYMQHIISWEGMAYLSESRITDLEIRFTPAELEILKGIEDSIEY